MAVIFNRSGKQWLFLAAFVLLEAAVMIPLVLMVPETSEGVGSWLLWVILLGINVLFARRYFAPLGHRQ